MHEAVAPLVQRLQRYAGQPQPPDADDVVDACQQLQAACDGMTAEQLVQQQVVSVLAQLAHALLDQVEQQQQQQQHLAAMQRAGGDIAPEFVLESMQAVIEQLECAASVFAHWDVRAATRAACAAAAAQIQRTALLPRLARQMEALWRAVLSRDGTALSAQALARPGGTLEACNGLLFWYNVLHCIWPSSLLASSAAGPVIVAAGQLLLAALMLAELCLARGEAGTQAMQQRTVLVVHGCRSFVGLVSLGRRQVAVMQAPFLRQVVESAAYPRLLLAHCLFACGGLLHKHADAAARQSLQPVVLQVAHELGLGPRLVRWCMHAAESEVECSAEVAFVNVVRELCTDEACDAIAQQQAALMAPVALLLLSTVAACVEGAGEEASMLMHMGACGAYTLLMRLEPHNAAAAAAGMAQLLGCALQLLELLLVQHRTSHNGMHAQAGLSLMLVLRCVALLCADGGNRAVSRSMLVRICSAAESLLRAPLLRGADSDLLGIAFGAVCALVHGEGAVIGPLLAAAGGDHQQQQAPFSLLVTVWKLLPELQQQHSSDSNVFIRAVVARQLEAFLQAARGGSGGSSGASSSASGASSSSSGGGGGVLHASSGGVPWLVLTAHAAHQAGTLLAAAAAPGAVQSAAPADAIRQWWELQASVTVGMCHAWLCAKPNTATPAAAAPAAPDVQLMQELQQQELLPALEQGSMLLFHAVSAVQSEGGTSSSSGGGGSSDSGSSDSGGNNTVTAAGLDPALLAAVKAAAAVSSAEVLHVLQRSFVATPLPQQLQDWAARLSAALPHRYCCNHPGCTNLAGVSELALVGGKGCICAGCRTARYCSAACQAAHWPQHRPVCRRLKREAAAVAAAAAASAAASASAPRV